MKVLVACEFSGIVRDAFAARGHDAWSCDLLPSERNGQHMQCDAIEAAYGHEWDLMIAHPPCTYLTNAGVRHLHDHVSSGYKNGKTVYGKERFQAMLKSAEFFLHLLNAPISKICIENPVPHKYAREKVGHYSQLVQPFQYGHPNTKATCFWLRRLPPLMHCRDVKAIMQTLPKRERHPIYYMAPRNDRGHERSKTYEGIARAMAEQWG
jgi:hypothetical protein